MLSARFLPIHWHSCRIYANTLKEVASDAVNVPRSPGFMFVWYLM